MSIHFEQKPSSISQKDLIRERRGNRRQRALGTVNEGRFVSGKWCEIRYRPGTADVQKQQGPYRGIDQSFIYIGHSRIALMDVTTGPYRITEPQNKKSEFELPAWLKNFGKKLT